MKIKNIISGVKTFAGRTFCKAKAHSPEILLVIGVAGVVGSTVLACKATLKAHDIKEEAERSLKEIHDCEADEGLADKYTEEDAAKDKVNLFIKTAVKLSGLYLPSALLGGCSVACILLSHKIMTDQKAAAIAFANTATAALAEYRTKIAEKYGSGADEEIRYGVSTNKSTDPALYSETDGSGKPIESEEKCAEIGDASLYATLIDRSCGIWDKSTDMTLMNLHSAIRHLNDTLTARATAKKPGYLFLWEVYDYLDIPRERWPKESYLVGWLYDKANEKLHNYVDFGPMYVLSREDADGGQYYIREEKGGSDQSVLIDFNIDGIIYDRI